MKGCGEQKQQGLRSTMMTKIRVTFLRILVIALAFSTIYYASPIQHDGDTHVYVADILRSREKNARDRILWESGHLLWRPLGYAVSTVRARVDASFEWNPDSVRQSLVAINFLAGLLYSFFLFLLLRLYVKTPVAAGLWLLFMLPNAFLNYVHSGCSYVPGLACLTGAIYCIASRRSQSLHSLVLSGALLAVGAALWIPYILAVPAAVLLLCVHNQQTRSVLKEAALLGSVFLVTVASMYLVAAVTVGVRSPGEFWVWMHESSHGIEKVRGVSRAVFGFARSFVFMGDDGNLYKRYLLHDPYNPVTFSDLVRLSLLKVGIFYLWLATVVVVCWRCCRKAIAASVLVGLASVFGFAVFWQGGDLERHIPSYPVLALGVAAGVGDGRCGRVKPLFLFTAVLALVVLLSNMFLRTSYVLSERHRNLARVHQVKAFVKANRLRHDDVLFVLSFHDPLLAVPKASTTQVDLRVHYLLWPGHRDSSLWKQQFAEQVLRYWAQGVRVWVSDRLLQPRPKAEWKWVEGDDPALKWSDLHSFFAEFNYGDRVGEPDGFVLLVRTPSNVYRLQCLVQESTPASTKGR